MALNQYTLTQKKKLTSDIYELIYEAKDLFKFTPGQFITFILPNIGGRAYSVLEIQGNQLTLIIKKWLQKDGGRGGSQYICNQEVGSSLSGTHPAGHFLLQKTENNKLFIGTGTGFVPLYNQILSAVKRKSEHKIVLLFGSRTSQDLFYREELEELSKKYENFDYQIYLSREKDTPHNIGYVTEYLSPQNIEQFQEFYICGAPQVIESSMEILQKNNISEDSIFHEKY
ncbi:MAG: FAD-dependent oxidoreductase [Candidatus Gracilibacteria bacterium]|nr:FAD-dependent oxidoreductase [Candidatus Gracilibacteria bacterium]